MMAAEHRPPHRWLGTLPSAVQNMLANLNHKTLPETPKEPKQKEPKQKKKEPKQKKKGAACRAAPFQSKGVNQRGPKKKKDAARQPRPSQKKPSISSEYQFSQ
jgi:hypothetical protein